MSLRKSKPESNITYRGRFAPSATGPLHIGSIYAALISYLDARDKEGEWLIRIDDLDTSRCKPKFTNEILECLHAFGLKASGPAIFQSDRINLYQNAFDKLSESGQLYSCFCSRKHLPRGYYPGYCRTQLGQTLLDKTTVRIDSRGMQLKFYDQIQGNFHKKSTGDFVVRRRDGLFSYQFACAVDESLDAITAVIRGIDLMPSTLMQIWIMEKLGLTIPQYAHHPILVDRLGVKLSKQTFAKPVNYSKPGQAYSVIAQILQIADYPSEDATGAIWIQFFETDVEMDQLLPKVTNLFFDSSK